MNPTRPNVLWIMTDQQRFDTIAGLGNQHIHTPHIDRLLGRGLHLTQAYSTCPICVPARHALHLGREPSQAGIWENHLDSPSDRPTSELEERCGPYVPRRMRSLGYRTFGVGKFHTTPLDADMGYDIHLRSEELWGSLAERGKDDYLRWLAREHPAFEFLEQPHGERSEMYFMPQMSPLPAEATVEAWAADRGIELISDRTDRRPFFGLVSFIGPHPPLAPPIPFNRRYDPDDLPGPVRGRIEVDHADDTIRAERIAMYADDLSDFSWRIAKARYYGEITYIDRQVGRLLDAVDRRADADNTIICFFSDHGEMLGDHHGCQKANFFDAAAKVPMLISWPDVLPAGGGHDGLTSLADLAGLAVRAAGGELDATRHDLLGCLRGESSPRTHLFGYVGRPGGPNFRAMVRSERWKYLFFSNGGRELLFNLSDDPNELDPIHEECSERCEALHTEIVRDLAGCVNTDWRGHDRIPSQPFSPVRADRVVQR